MAPLIMGMERDKLISYENEQYTFIRCYTYNFMLLKRQIYQHMILGTITTNIWIQAGFHYLHFQV